MASRKWNVCRVCETATLESIVNLGFQPLSSVFPEPSEVCPSNGELHLVRCSKCDLVQLESTADLAEMYGLTYGYHTSLSPMMLNHIQNLADDILANSTEISVPSILDIGSNDASLLKCFQAAGWDCVGIDPSSEKFSSYYTGIAQIVDFFSKDAVTEVELNKKFSVITSIAMFYDIDDPVAFAKDVSALLTEGGVWVVEMAYLPLFMSQLSYDQICHEHVTYYTLRSFSVILEQAGLEAIKVEFNDMNGGSFRVYSSQVGSRNESQTAAINNILSAESCWCSMRSYKDLAHRIRDHRGQVRALIQQLTQGGRRVLGYGASTKGNIVLNYCDITANDIEFIVDANSEKDGLETPGTRIPIKSKSFLRDPGHVNPVVLCFVWHLRNEILLQEESLIRKGATFIFLLPRIHFVTRENIDNYIGRDFTDLRFALTEE